MSSQNIAYYCDLLKISSNGLCYTTVYNTNDSMDSLFRIQGDAATCWDVYAALPDCVTLHTVEENPMRIMYTREKATEIAKKTKFAKMVKELNEFNREKGNYIQFSIDGRSVVLLDYSIVASRKEYADAPIYVIHHAKKILVNDYILLKMGMIA